MEINHVLIVEDDKEIREGVQIYLQSQGYVVFQAADGIEGLEILEKEEIHLAIIDIMMPRMDGIRMTMKLREKYDFPVIMLSAKSEEVDKITGLNIGADDYVTKPFTPMELMARVNSQLRRYRKFLEKLAPQENTHVIGGLEINEDMVEVSMDGNPVKLTPIEYKILLLLAKNPGRSLPAGFEPALLVANFLLWMFMFGILFWCVTSLRAMFRMKKAYWTERTLTAKMLRKMKNKGEESGGKIQKKVKSIGRKIRNFFARQYDALLHLDFQDKTNRTILRVVLINFAILFVVCLFWWYGTVALIVYSVMLFMFLKKYTQDLSEKYALLLKSTNQLAEGHLDIPIEGDVGLFNPIQEELKRIQKGFKKAVDEEVKNERMKTELVTNVSHDLRTPLTAIITYTDLLKNEKDEEKRKEYISVLERKSLRLKVLIEDLFEISKAASKSVVMHFMKVDIVGLFKQVELENVEKIKAANLEFRTKIPEQKVVMWLDSEKTYRIFENLIVNITKYAMPHTRVYIDMTETEDGVHITMKNVSAAELNFNADEITDRFVRGDSARNTEGSGLGLAIAKSFAELQHGSLKISTEADLFKADLYLPKSKEMPEKPGGGYPENL